MIHIKTSDPDLLITSYSVDCIPPFPTAGSLVIPMTNDYLFRALLQRNNRVLKGLICSLLHLPQNEVSSAVITNPIELGTSIGDKTFIEAYENVRPVIQIGLLNSKQKLPRSKD